MTVSFTEALRTWTRVALLSFGGPAGQIAVMHRILVEEKRWIGEERFLHALNFCMLLPLQACLDRIHELEPAIHAWTQVSPERQPVEARCREFRSASRTSQRPDVDMLRAARSLILHTVDIYVDYT
jgi:Chromate transporter